MEPGVFGTSVLAIRGDAEESRTDLLAGEEPLEIRAEGPDKQEVQVAITMRTPGHDLELAAGFLYTEGLLAGPADLGDPPLRGLVLSGAGNRITLRLRRKFDGERLRRNFYATSSCGICGKASIDQIEVAVPTAAALPAAEPLVSRQVLWELPAKLRAAQAVFEKTGGLHATGLFDEEGRLLSLYEDVGRHNAFDKVVGRALLDGRLPLHRSLVLVSGRLSFEIVQKAAMAGVPVLCAVSAPSSLAVEAGARLGLTIVGFLRGADFNVYSHPERIS